MLRIFDPFFSELEAMTLLPPIHFDLQNFRKEALKELVELQRQARDDFVKWAAEKLAKARKEFGRCVSLEFTDNSLCC